MTPRPWKLVSLELVDKYKAKISRETFGHPTYGKLSWKILQMEIGINGRKRWYAVAVDKNSIHRHNYVEPERAEPLSHLELAQILTSNGNEGLRDNPDWPTWFYGQSFSGLRDSIQQAWNKYRHLVEEHRSAPSRHSTPDIVRKLRCSDTYRLTPHVDVSRYWKSISKIIRNCLNIPRKFQSVIPLAGSVLGPQELISFTTWLLAWFRVTLSPKL